MSTCVIMWVVLHDKGVPTVHVWGISSAQSEAAFPAIVEKSGAWALSASR